MDTVRNCLGVTGTKHACGIERGAPSLTAMWVTNAVQEIAARIVDDRNELLKQRIGSLPQHVLSDIPEKQPQKRPVLPATSAGTPAATRCGENQARPLESRVLTIRVNYLTQSRELLCVKYIVVLIYGSMFQ